MDTKSLLVGIISFIAGGLLVSIVATASPPQHAMMGVSNTLRSAHGNEFDEVFLTDMIAHHQGAVEMARLAQERAQHADIRRLSEDIIRAQEKEINQMRDWQNQWGHARQH